MSTQRAAVFTDSTDKANLVKVAEIPVPEISETQILIKAVAYAANPTDWKHRYGMGGEENDVVGSDVSGYVAKTGAKVTNVKEGDIVSATLRGNFKPNNGAFAQYVAAESHMAIKYDTSKLKFDENKRLPQGLNPSTPLDTFEAAASVTLGLGTLGMSFGSNFGLSSKDKAANASKAILIWGGATATGILAIQVAKAVFGLTVFATASPKQHEFLTSLGADKVFDYRDEQVIENIKNYAKGKIAYALDTISSKDTWQQTYDATEGSEHVHLDNLLFLKEQDIKTDAKRNVDFHITLMYLVSGEDQYVGDQLLAKSSPELVSNFKKFWEEDLHPHLSQLRTAKLNVLAPGLESAGKSLELLIDGAQSAEKIVFHYE